VREIKNYFTSRVSEGEKNYFTNRASEGDKELLHK
jgi:hypothetical protein